MKTNSSEVVLYYKHFDKMRKIEVSTKKFTEKDIQKSTS